MANSDIDKDLTRTQDDVKIWPLATVPVQLSRLHERSPSGTTSPHSAALNSQVMAMADGSGFQKLTRKVMPRVLAEIKTARAPVGHTIGGLEIQAKPHSNTEGLISQSRGVIDR